MVEKVRPHKQNSFRQTSEFANIARTVGEVDDFVMQEFLTDIIDGGVGPAVLGAGDGLSPGGSLQPQPSFGVAYFNAPLMQTNPFPAMDMEAPPGAQVPVGAAPLGVPADPAAFARGAADPPKKPAKGKKTRRASRVSNNGSDDDEAADAEQRRKRQREANLQAQRRCRERHRTHVTNLEAEVDALRAKADAAAAESARLQASLQRSLMGLEECQQRWQTMEQEKVDMRQMKEYAEAKLAQTLEALRECASKNGALVDELRRSASPASSAGQVPPIAPPPGTAPRARRCRTTSATRCRAWTSRSPRRRSRPSRSRSACSAGPSPRARTRRRRRWRPRATTRRRYSATRRRWSSRRRLARRARAR